MYYRPQLAHSYTYQPTPSPEGFSPATVGESVVASSINTGAAAQLRGVQQAADPRPSIPGAIDIVAARRASSHRSQRTSMDPRGVGQHFKGEQIQKSKSQSPDDLQFHLELSSESENEEKTESCNPGKAKAHVAAVPAYLPKAMSAAAAVPAAAAAIAIPVPTRQACLEEIQSGNTIHRVPSVDSDTDALAKLSLADLKEALSKDLDPDQNPSIRMRAQRPSRMLTPANPDAEGIFQMD